MSNIIRFQLIKLNRPITKILLSAVLLVIPLVILVLVAFNPREQVEEFMGLIAAAESFAIINSVVIIAIVARLVGSDYDLGLMKSLAVSQPNRRQLFFGLSFGPIAAMTIAAFLSAIVINLVAHGLAMAIDVPSPGVLSSDTALNIGKSTAQVLYASTIASLCAFLFRSASISLGVALGWFFAIEPLMILMWDKFRYLPGTQLLVAFDPLESNGAQLAAAAIFVASLAILALGTGALFVSRDIES